MTRRQAVLFAVCAALFALITWQVTAGGPLRAADESVDRDVVLRGPQGVLEVLSDLGSMPVALPVLAVALGYAAWRGARRAALAGALAMALVPVLVVPLKIWIARPGPVTHTTGYYPSGHTATAMVAYGAAALVLTPRAGRRGPAVAAWSAAGLLTAATAVGLVLHGYHWPLDVLASGALCGMVLTALAVALGRPARDGTPSPGAPEPERAPA